MIQTLRRYFVQPVFSHRQKFWLWVSFGAIFAALLCDQAVMETVGTVRVFPLDAFMLFMTDFGMLFSILMLLFYLLEKRKFLDVGLTLVTGGSALQISYLMKMLFQTPRPYAAAVVATIPLTQASGFSMPSLHTAFCFSMWPFLSRIFPSKKLQLLGKIIIITIALSRLYLGVHYLSDLIMGGIIGYTVASFWVYLEEKHRIIEAFIFQVKDKLELRRQVGHLMTGSMIVLLLKLQLLNAELLFAVLIIGGSLSLIMRKYKIPVLYDMLLFFERPEDLRNFPGKGSFFLVLGALLSVILFPHDIALASIAIMAVGDAVTTIIGKYFGKIKNPLNPQKHLEGTAIAIVVSTFVAFFFVPFSTAFIGSLVGMIFESITVRYISRIVDDNVIIPVVAGVAMVMMG